MPLFLCVYSFITTICALILLLGVYQKNTNAICISKRRLDGKTTIVTGGTSGMGLEIAKDFALRGARVIIVCPFEEEGKNARELIIKSTGNKNVIFELMDLSSFASVRNFAATILENESRLDILVNNAGISAGRRIKEGYNIVMHINYLGTVLLTLLLLPLLEKSGESEEPSRIVNTASVSHNIGRVDFESWKKSGLAFKYYANSKLCTSLFTRELAKRLDKSKVIVNTVDPGIVGTRIYKIGTNALFGSLFVFLAMYCSKNAFEGAQTAIHAAVCEKARKETGVYFFNCKPTRKATLSWYNDDKTNKLLWEKTMEAINFEIN